MARRLNRGEIWLHTFAAPDKRHPVLILSRQSVIGAHALHLGCVLVTDDVDEFCRLQGLKVESWRRPSTASDRED